MSTRLLAGDCRARLSELAAASVHCCVTSPPYYGLRSYQTEPQVWGGEADCGHEWGEELPPVGQTGGLTAKQLSNPGSYSRASGGSTCRLCHAWRGELGLEPTPALYVAHLLEVFAAVRRVLRPDATLWVNLGDSYNTVPGPGGSVFSNGRTDGRKGTPGDTARADAGRKTVARRPVGSGLPAGSLLQIPARFSLAMQEAGWLLRSAIVLAKCLSGGTVVYARTQKGEMPMTVKDLVRLKPATVQLWNGERWMQVLGFEETPRGESNIEIEFRNGERIGCTREHLWPTQRGNVRADEIQIGDIVPHCRLPEPETPGLPAALDDELVGWFVGLYIAEGSAYEDSLTIHGHAREAERHARLREFVAAFDGYLTVRTNGNRAAVTIHGPIIRAIIDAYVNGKGAAGKHLHPRAWQRSDRFLQAVLQGYLDGDGGRRDKEKFWTLGFCCNDAWAQDLRTLGGRLGVKVFLRRARHRMGEREFPGWKGYLRLTPTDHWSAKAPGQVVAIRQSRARKFWDISVADEPHIFALASGLLTHNSAPMPESVNGCRWERCRVKTKGQTMGTQPYRQGAYGGKQRDAAGGVFQGDAEYTDCPGCPRCSGSDGMVLRWGSGRPTSAYEYLYLFSCGPRYFYNTEAVRVAHKPESIERAGYVHSPGTNTNGDRGDNGRFVGGAPNPAGANARNVLAWRPAPLADAHYAAFPPFIPEFAIRAGTAPQCCGECGAPYAPVVEREFVPERRRGTGKPLEAALRVSRERGMTEHSEWSGTYATRIPAWRPTCRHQAPSVPATVLDCFGGSGTTGLAADRLGRDAILIDLNPDYVAIAERRSVDDAGLFAQVEVNHLLPPAIKDEFNVTVTMAAGDLEQLAWEF